MLLYFTVVRSRRAMSEATQTDCLEEQGDSAMLATLLLLSLGNTLRK